LRSPFFSDTDLTMKTFLMIAVVTVFAVNLVACATPEERARRDAERRREDARWEAEQRQRDREYERRDREYERRYGPGHGMGRYWY